MPWQSGLSGSTSNAADVVEPPFRCTLDDAGARNDRTKTARRAQATRRVAALLGSRQVTRRIDALITRSVQPDFIDG